MKLFNVIGFRGTWTNNRNRCPVPDTDGFRITYPYMISMTCSQDFSALKTIQMSDRILFFVDVDILTLKPDLKPVFGIGKMVDSYYGLRPSRHISRIDVVATWRRHINVNATSFRRHCSLGEACRRMQLV